MKKALFFVMAILLGHLAFATATSPGNWRWRNDDGNETTATWSAAESTPLTLTSTASAIRLRLNLYSNTGASGYSDSAVLQYTSDTSAAKDPGSLNAGIWITIPKSGTGSTAFTASVSSVLGSATINPTTPQLSQSGTRTDAFGGGAVFTSNNGGFGTLVDNKRYENEFTIKPTSRIANNTKYFFRFYDVTHNQTPATANYLNGVPYLVTSANISPSLPSPGGVSADLKLWLKANKDVILGINGNDSVWYDQSGHIFDVSQTVATSQPTLVANGMNFNPALNFSTAYLQRNGGVMSNVSYTGASTFVVGKEVARTASYSLYQGTSSYVGLTGPWSDGNLYFGYGPGQSAGYASGVTVGSTNLFAGISTNSPSNSQRGVINGTQVGSGTAAATYTANFGDLGIGGTGAGGSLYNGNLGEAIIYSRGLTTSEEQRVNSYQAIKYGLTLSHKYFSSAGTILWDTAVNKGYNSNIFGIAKDVTSALDQEISTSSSFTGTNPVIVSGATGAFPTTNALATSVLTDGQALMAGNNGLAGNVLNSTFLASHIDSLSKTVWKVENTGTVGNVRIGVPTSGTSKPYALLVSSNPTFPIGSTTIYTLSSSGGYYSAANVALADGMYFTFGFNANFSVYYSTGAVSTSGGADGSATITINGGTAPYTIAWSTGATTASVTGLTAGRYTVTVTDNVGASLKRIIEVNTQGIRWGWGYNGNGQLGNGTTANSNIPALVGSPVDKYVAVSAFYQSSLGIKADGSLWAWGYNSNGQLGDGTVTGRTRPVAVSAGSTWQTISAGVYHSAGIKTDGTLWTWGYNGYGQLGDGTVTENHKPQQVGTDKWIAVASGGYHTLGIKADGTLWTWGDNGNGQLGIGSTTDSHIPVQIGTATTWVSVTAGDFFSTALKSDGTIWSSGLNNYGMLGNGNTTQQTSFVQESTLATNWITIKAQRGTGFVSALKTNGTAYAWGYNGNGNFGNGATNGGATSSPVQVGSATNWYNTAIGDLHTLAVTTSGTIYSAGLNDNGQLGNGTTTQNNTLTAIPFALYSPNPNTWGSIAGGYRYSIGLSNTPNAPVPVISTTEGDTSYNNPIPVTINFTQAVTGFVLADITVANGTANSFVQVNDSTYTINVVPTGYGSIVTVSIAAGAATSKYTALTSLVATPLVVTYLEGLKVIYTVTPVSATTVTAGVSTVNTNGGAAITISGGIAPYTQVWSSTETGTAITGKAAGFYTVVVTDAVGNTQSRYIEIPTTGNLWVWGYNGYGELGNGTNASKAKPTFVGPVTNTFIALSAMNATSAGIRPDGTLWMWGYNGLAEQGNGTYNWSNTPVQVGTGTTWRAVSSGYFHTMAIKTDGTLWGWGYNGYGELGDGTNTLRTTPVQIGTDKWIAVSAGYIHTIGIKSDGTLWSWGYNGNGQSGNGTYTWSNVPVRIGTDNSWISASTGSYYSVALKSDSTAWSFGYNGLGNLGDGTTVQRNAPVQFGTASNWTVINPSGYGSANMTNAIQGDGSMWGSGWNGLGQKGDGTTTTTYTPTKVAGSTGYVDVKQSGYTTMARQNDASLWAWGYNGWHGVGDGTYTTRLSPVPVVRPTGLTDNATNWAAFASAYYHGMALAPAPDKPIPDISSIYSDTTSLSTIPVVITFSEAVTGFTVSDIAITGGTIVGGSFSGSGTTYTINISPLATAAGTYSHILLDIAANQAVSVSTASGNLVADEFDIAYYAPPTIAGPGGVANPTTWFRADQNVYSDSGVTVATNGSAVKQWSNSGTGTIHLASVYSDSTATAPTFTANDINFNPGLTFSGTNQTVLSKIGREHTIDLFTPLAYSHFSVMKSSTAGVVWNYGKNLSSPSGNKTGFEQTAAAVYTLYHNSSSTDADATSQWKSQGKPFTTSDGTWLGDAVYNGGTSLTTSVNTITASQTSHGTIATLPSLLNNDFRIGNSSDNASGLTGEIPEIVVYNSALSTTDQAKVRTYMAIKYGSTLGTVSSPYSYINSAGTTIWTGSATYQYDIAGIERDDNGSIYQKQSQSVNSGNGVQPIIGITGIATTNALNTNTLTNATAEVIGNNNGSASLATTFTAITPLTLRMARVWQVQETGTVGAVQVAIPSSIFTGCKALVTSSVATFASGNTAYYSIGNQTINGVVCELFNVDFTNGSFFTFATSPTNTPSLVAANTLKTAVANACSTDTAGNIQYVDGTTPANKYLAINPGTNTGYSFTVTASNNSPTIGNQVKTSGTTNTTALSNRLYTIQDAGTNNYPSGMKVRIYYAPADTTAAVAALSSSVTSPATSQWFKFSGSTHAANVAAILAAQTATGITGATFITPSAKGVENGVNYVEFNNITSFSTFGYLAAKTAVVLPVSITSFTTTANGCAATLNWVTATESNSNYYDVEASADGSSFSKAGEVKSKNSSTGASYSYVDNSLTGGITYFRLKAVDKDGTFAYSQIVTVITDCNSSHLSVSPNPTNNLVKVQGLQSGSHLQLFDANGKKLIELIASSTSQTVDLSMFAKGVYILRTQASNGAVTNLKVVKQ